MSKNRKRSLKHRKRTYYVPGTRIRSRKKKKKPTLSQIVRALQRETGRLGMRTSGDLSTATVRTRGERPGQVFLRLPDDSQEKLAVSAISSVDLATDNGSVFFDTDGTPYAIYVRLLPQTHVTTSNKEGVATQHRFNLYTIDGPVISIPARPEEGSQIVPPYNLDPAVFMSTGRGWRAVKRWANAARSWTPVFQLEADSFTAAKKSLGTATVPPEHPELAAAIRRAEDKVETITKEYEGLLRTAKKGTPDQVRQRLIKYYAHLKALAQDKDIKIWWAIEMAKKQPSTKYTKVLQQDTDEKPTGVRDPLRRGALGGIEQGRLKIPHEIVRGLGFANAHTVAGILRAEGNKHQLWFPLVDPHGKLQRKIFGKKLETPADVNKLISASRNISTRGRIYLVGKRGGQLDNVLLRANSRIRRLRTASQGWEAILIPLDVLVRHVDLPRAMLKPGERIMHGKLGQLRVISRTDTKLLGPGRTE